LNQGCCNLADNLSLKNFFGNVVCFSTKRIGIASGKREIHFNKSLLYHDVVPNRGVQRFDHTFTIPEFTLAGGHIIHITALTFAFSEAEQFVITVNGQCYDEFLNIYELGAPSMYRIYGVLLENYARYRRGLSTQRLQLTDRANQNENNIADRTKYLPIPDEGKIKDAKNYSMMPISKKEERKMMALATEQSLQDKSTVDKLHQSTLERLSSIQSYHMAPAPIPQPPVVVDLLGLNSDSVPVKSTNSDQVLLSFNDNYDSHSNHHDELLYSYSSLSGVSSMSGKGRETPMMFSAPPPAWETLQRDFSMSFASPPSNAATNNTMKYYQANY